MTELSIDLFDDTSMGIEVDKSISIELMKRFDFMDKRNVAELIDWLDIYQLHSASRGEIAEHDKIYIELVHAGYRPAEYINAVDMRELSSNDFANRVIGICLNGLMISKVVPSLIRELSEEYRKRSGRSTRDEKDTEFKMMMEQFRTLDKKDKTKLLKWLKEFQPLSEYTGLVHGCSDILYELEYAGYYSGMNSEKAKRMNLTDEEYTDWLIGQAIRDLETVKMITPLFCKFMNCLRCDTTEFTSKPKKDLMSMVNNVNKRIGV